MLSFLAVFKFLRGESEAALVDFDDACAVQEKDWKRAPNSSDSLFTWVRSVARAVVRYRPNLTAAVPDSVFQLPK